MRLSTEEVDEARAIATIHAALDAGATWLDTAPTYAPSAEGTGHGERLVARALAAWTGDRRGVKVITKGGMTRADRAWIPDGRGKSIAAACEASLHALGVERIDLYLLHAPDPRTPLATSVRALERLRRGGPVGAIGLCNVSVLQLREACELAEISAVQIELSPLHPDGLRSGVPAWCIERGIAVFAHRPLGGPAGARRIGRDATLVRIAERHGVDPHVVALAWAGDLHPSIVVLPGATRPEHAARLAHARALVLDDEDRERLDARFVAGDLLRRPIATRRPPIGCEGDVVLVMGVPAAGKSTHAAALVEAGHLRLNRDELGGRLSGIVQRLDQALAAGTRRIVLDNTYLSRASRSAVIETAWRHGVPVRCVFVDANAEQAAAQAVVRMLRAHGRLLEPAEIEAHARTDPHAFGPHVLARARRTLEPPEADEGFATIERVVPPALPAFGPTRALFVAAPLLESPGRALVAEVRRHLQAGAVVLAVAWDGEGRGAPSEHAWAATCTPFGVPAGGFRRLACPHPAGAPICWCRPPLPGLPIAAAHALSLDLGASAMLGRTSADRTLALSAGLAFIDAHAAEKVLGEHSR
jgi:aryl-alcohol dehydrogenase-like predicted oxidoreductase/predicted kinase